MLHKADPLTKPRPFQELRQALKEYADIEVSTATLYRLAKRGELPTSEVGGRKRSTIQAYLDAMAPPTIQTAADSSKAATQAA